MKIKVTGQEDIDWINLDQNRGQWQAVVSKVMNLMCHKKSRSFLGSCEINDCSCSV